MSRPQTMNAWRKHSGILTPVREEVPVPEVPSKGFLVKVLAAGVCHSDYALVQLKQPLPNFHEKYTLGHEGCGEIIEIGNEVKGPRFEIGTRIAILSVAGCGEQTCLECGNGSPQLCKNAPCLGIGQDGSFAPYVAVPYRAAAVVPEGVSSAQAAVTTDAVLTAFHAVKRVGAVKPTDTVVIFGLGGLGFNALQIVLALGSRVIVMDKREEILAEAVSFGVPKQDVIPVGKDPVEFVQEHKLVVDVVIDFVGVSDTFAASQQLVRSAGRIVQVGLLGAELTVNNPLCVRKRLSVLFSYGGFMEDLEDSLDLVAKGALKPQVETGDMDDFPDVLDRLHHGKIKSRIVLLPKHHPNSHI